MCETILSDELTSEEARKAFASNLTYAQVDPNDIQALEGYLAIEYARHERMGEHMEMRPFYRNKFQPEIYVSDCGGIGSAFLRVSGFYFSDREAISFNKDGFIGFAGWADDVNVQPFLRAFMRWLADWMGCKNMRRSAAAPAAVSAVQNAALPACASMTVGEVVHAAGYPGWHAQGGIGGAPEGALKAEPGEVLITAADVAEAIAKAVKDSAPKPKPAAIATEVCQNTAKSERASRVLKEDRTAEYMRCLEYGA